MSKRPAKLNYGYPPGTIVEATDTKYEVAQDGSWRRVHGAVEKVTPPPRPICKDGKSTYDGSRCYCKICAAERKQKPGVRSQEPEGEKA